MSITKQEPEKAFQKYAWMILFILAILLTLSSFFIAVNAGVDMSDFESSTGFQWSDFTATQPTVAQYIVRLERLIGLSFVGFTLLCAAIVWTGYRTGEKQAWIILWLFPTILGLIAVVFFIADASALGMFYGAAAAIAVIGLLLPVQKFFPQR